MPRPKMPKHDFPEEKIREFTIIIAERMNIDLAPGVINLPVERMLAKMLKAAMKPTRASTEFHDELMDCGTAAIYHFVDRNRAEQEHSEWQKTCRRSSRYTLTSTPDTMREQFDRYGSNSKGRERF